MLWIVHTSTAGNLLKMMYQFEQDYVFDSTRFEKVLDVTWHPGGKGIEETFCFLQHQSGK